MSDTSILITPCGGLATVLTFLRPGATGLGPEMAARCTHDRQALCCRLPQRSAKMAHPMPHTLPPCFATCCSNCDELLPHTQAALTTVGE